MHEMKVFSSEQFGNVRVVEKGGEPWFVVADICAILDIRTNDALNGLDEDEKGYDNIVTPGGPQQMAIISEPGLYSLILRSRKPETKAFKRWVCHEVIPAIRHTGEYALDREMPSAFNPELLSSSYRKPFPFQRRILKIIEGAPYKIGTADVSASYIQMRLGPGMVTAERLREMLGDLLTQGLVETLGYTPPRGPATLHWQITPKGREFLGLMNSNTFDFDPE